MSGWAKKAVAKMTDAEVRHWLQRLGAIDSMGRPDARTPLERMIDAATGADRPEPRVEKYNPPNGEAKVPGPYETPPPPSRRRRVKKPKQVRR